MTVECPLRKILFTEVDRAMAAPDVSLHEVLANFLSFEVQEQTANSAVAVVEVGPEATGKALLVRDPSGDWAANSLTTCLP